MKSSTTGIIKLIFSILTLYLIHTFFFKVFALIGIHFKGISYDIMNLVKYILMSVLVFIIYHGNIKMGQRSYNNHLLNNIIYTFSCFLFLMAITILIHEVLKYFGYNTKYNFYNYFNKTLNLKLILSFIENCFILPFLYCIIFPLGFSCIFKKCFGASVISGITYGILYGIHLHTNLMNALILSITPMIITMLLTYLYKVNNNIWNSICTYIMYVIFGVFLLNYLV